MKVETQSSPSQTSGISPLPLSIPSRQSSFIPTHSVKICQSSVLSRIPESFTITDHNLFSLCNSFSPRAPSLAWTQHKYADPPFESAESRPNLDQAVTELCIRSGASDPAIVVDEASLVAALGGVDSEP